MPLSSKGEEILANMRKEYGDKKGESVFYASKNAGKISGVDRSDKIAAIGDCVKRLMDGVGRLDARMGSRADASLEYHKASADFAKKTANKAMEAGQHDVAKKWIEYGARHGEEAAKKEPKIEGPPDDAPPGAKEDAKKDAKKKK